jgi:hypothetical protein
MTLATQENTGGLDRHHRPTGPATDTANGSATARLLRLWFRIPQSNMDVCLL